MAEIVDSREILARVRAERAEPPRPLMREMSPPDPFPVEALGTVLANAAVGIQDRTRAPIAICGQSVMAAATLATQAHADVRLATGQLRPLSNFFATVAVTGERKTAADAEALWPNRKGEEALREKYGPARQEYEDARKAWESARSRRKGWQGKCRRDQGGTRTTWAATKRAIAAIPFGHRADH